MSGRFGIEAKETEVRTVLNSLGPFILPPPSQIKLGALA